MEKNRMEQTETCNCKAGSDMNRRPETPLAFLERLQEQLAAQERDVEEKLSALLKQQEETRSELSRVQAALAAFRNVEAHAREDERPPTIQAGVLRILATAPNGMSALRILDELKARFDMDIARSSLSPQLSRLKAMGRLKLDGMIWSLTRK